MRNKRKNFITVVLLVILTNAVFVSGAFFLFYNINLKKKSINKVKKDIVFYEKRIENIKSIEKSLSNSEENSNAIKKVFLDKESIIDFIKRLEYLAGLTNVRLDMKSVNISAESNRAPVFSFDINGSFSNVYDYLVFIENESYQIALNKIYFQKSEELPGWEASFELELLSFKNNGVSN